jgi:uncharacterized alkaline shock family protein YloU
MTDQAPTSNEKKGAKVKGSIGLSPGAVAVIAGRAAVECYGIVGMASRRPIDGIARVLHISNLGRGVEVRIRNDEIVIELYVIVEYGTRISEVARNVQSQVKFAVEKNVGIPVRAVNVNVEDLHVTRSRN